MILLKKESLNFSLITQPHEKLQILAQPKAFYRERYCSETDPKKNRAQRFIRSEDDNNTHEYPTVHVSDQLNYFFSHIKISFF